MVSRANLIKKQQEAKNKKKVPQAVSNSQTAVAKTGNNKKSTGSTKSAKGTGNVFTKGFEQAKKSVQKVNNGEKAKKSQYSSKNTKSSASKTIKSSRLSLIEKQKEERKNKGKATEAYSKYKYWDWNKNLRGLDGTVFGDKMNIDTGLEVAEKTLDELGFEKRDSDFYSPESQRLRRIKNDALFNDDENRRYAESILNDEYKRIKKAHPELSDKEIYTWLEKWGNEQGYGSAYAEIVKKEIEYSDAKDTVKKYIDTYGEEKGLTNLQERLAGLNPTAETQRIREVVEEYLFEKAQYASTPEDAERYRMVNRIFQDFTPTTSKLGRAVKSAQSGVAQGVASLGVVAGGSDGEMADGLLKYMELGQIAKSGSGKLEGIGLDLINIAGEQIASYLIGGKYAKYIGSVLTGLQSGGKGLVIAKDNGASDAQAYSSALVNAVLESAFSYIPLSNLQKMRKGDTVDLLKSFISEQPLWKGFVKKVGKQFGTEAIQEGMTTVAQIIADEVIYTDEIQKKGFWNFTKETGAEALYSMLLGGLFGGAVGSPYALSSVRSEKAISELVNKLSYGLGISPQGIQEAINDGSIKELAMIADDKVSASVSKADFMKDVIRLANGEMNSNEVLVINEKTPQILQKYGANNNKITMSQSTVYKIVYPEGYMGGKHNLGFDALAMLPEQLADPIAIFKSATQKDSHVVLTELVDSNNNPVIVPIHLDKNNRIEIVNEIPSAYGKDDFDKFIANQEKSGNVLYVKKEKDLRKLPVNGLQLSEREALSDPIFNNSIPQTDAVGKGQNVGISRQKMAVYSQFSAFANSKGGSMIIDRRLHSGNPGYVVKHNDGSFQIVVSDEALVDTVVAAHVLTYVLEGTKEYNALLDFIKNDLENRGVNYNNVLDEIVADYYKYGTQIGREGAENKLVAMYSAKHLFNDEITIKRMLNEKPSLFQRILEWLQDLVARVHRNKDTMVYVRARNLYIKAWRSAGGQWKGKVGEEGSIQNSIVSGPKGKYVSYDTNMADAFNGVDIDSISQNSQDNTQKSHNTDIDEIINRNMKDDWYEVTRSFDKAKKKIKFARPENQIRNETAEEKPIKVKNKETVKTVENNVQNDEKEVVVEQSEVKAEPTVESKSDGKADESYKVSAEEAKLYFSKHKKKVTASEHEESISRMENMSEAYDNLSLSKKLPNGTYELRENIADILGCRDRACVNAAEVIDSFVLVHGSRIDKKQRDAFFEIFESELMENAEADPNELVKKRRAFDYYIDCLEAFAKAKSDSKVDDIIDIKSEESVEYFTAGGEKVEMSFNRGFEIDGLFVVNIVNDGNDKKSPDVVVLKNRIFAELDENTRKVYVGLKKTADEPDYITIARFNALNVDRYYKSVIEPLRNKLKVLELTADEKALADSLIKNGNILNNVPYGIDVDKNKVTEAVAIIKKINESIKAIENISFRVPYDFSARYYTAELNSGGKFINDVGTFKNIYDNFATALKNATSEAKAYFDKVIFERLRNSKRDFVRGIEKQSENLKKQVIDLGIFGGTKESAAVQWYGEGVKPVMQGKKQVLVKYDLNDLKAEFDYTMKNGKKAWENIVAADEFFRKEYYSYAEKVNDVLKVIYPNPYDEKGEVIPGRRLLTRKDYYHHFYDEGMGIESIADVLINTGTEIDPHLLGISENTKPKTRWTSYLQHRGEGAYTADAVGGFIRYMQLAEYKIAIEPLIPEYRQILEAMKDGADDVRKGQSAGKKVDNAQEKQYEGNEEYADDKDPGKVLHDKKSKKNGLLDSFDKFINELAGKSNPVDRVLYGLKGDAKGRSFLNGLSRFMGKAKAAAIAGNVATMIVQTANAKNFAPLVSKKSLGKALSQIRSLQICGKLGNHNEEILKLLKESVFISERYLQRNYRGFEKGMLFGMNTGFFKKAEDWATYGLEIGDELVTKVGWLGAYYDAVKKGEADPIRYADDIARTAVAGRGIGEMPAVVKSRLVNAVIPFQVEVLNNLNLRKKIWQTGSVGKIAKGFLELYLGTFIVNELYEALLGRRVDFDPINLILSIIGEWDEEEESYYEKQGWVEKEKSGMMPGVKDYTHEEHENRFKMNFYKSVDAFFAISGEWLSNLPGMSFVASICAESDDLAKIFNNQFGENSPNRYGDGLIGIKTVVKEVCKFFDGQAVNWKNLIFSYAKYGKQISRVLQFLEDYNFIPDVNLDKEKGFWINGHSLDGTFEFFGDQTGRFADWGDLSYSLDKNFGDMAKDLLFGGNSTVSGKAWADSDFESGLDEFETTAWKGLVDEGYKPSAAQQFVSVISEQGDYRLKGALLEKATLSDKTKANLYYNLVLNDEHRIKFKKLTNAGASIVGAYKFMNYETKVDAMNGGYASIDYACALKLTGMSKEQQCKIYFEEYIPDFQKELCAEFEKQGFSKQDFFDVVSLGFSLDWKPDEPDEIARYNKYLAKAMETIDPKYILMTIGARDTFNKENSYQQGLDEWAWTDRIKAMINSFPVSRSEKDTLNNIIFNTGSNYFSPWNGKPQNWKGSAMPTGYMWDVDSVDVYTPDVIKDFINDGGYADPDKYTKLYKKGANMVQSAKYKDKFNKDNRKVYDNYLWDKFRKLYS